MLTAHRKLLNSFKVKVAKNATWQDVPLCDKYELRKIKAPKYFAELRITSGSTGEPLHIFYSKGAVDAFVERAAISLQKSRVTRKDVVLNLFAYGNYIPGSMYERACFREGISVIPLGAPNTYSKEKTLDVITLLKPNVWMSVPSYALTLLDILSNTKRADAFPDKVIVAGENLLDAYIEKFNSFGVEVINHFGLTECPAIGVSVKNNPKVLDIIDHGIYIESVEDHGVRHLVVTDVLNTATPIIRYKTGDVVTVIRENKAGGTVQLNRVSIVGRSDDLIKIQGVLVSQKKIIDILLRFSDTFIVYVKTKNSRDFLEVVLPSKYRKYQAEIEAALAFIKKKEICFEKDVVVPVTSSFKKRYIHDMRR